MKYSPTVVVGVLVTIVVCTIIDVLVIVVKSCAVANTVCVRRMVSGSDRSVVMDTSVTDIVVLSVTAGGVIVAENGIEAMFVAVEVIVHMTLPTSAGLLITGTGGLTLGTCMLDEESGMLIDGIAELMPGMLSDGSGGLIEGNALSIAGSEPLIDGIGALTLGSGILDGDRGILSDGTAEPIAGAPKNGSEELIEGRLVSTEGMGTSRDCESGLPSGILMLADGGDALRIGFVELKDGSGALAEGSALIEGTTTTSEFNGGLIIAGGTTLVDWPLAGTSPIALTERLESPPVAPVAGLDKLGARLCPPL